ncbi:bifunctional DNA-binding transcriptional regulator/O6-methylguanine-DNA methyltransferase Ada [Terrihabitans rhizophilus]|uniref:Bifunctional DNA-binding transcriptional regulator/O6-methylguanine-DNA methyltransferase Ada n=1 Tax=Terrihabitans rhizophilus TaxID=3092662 RepID=A0ABU4RJN4_9HYPH|nr:bifunctional DNA-binding transcriptional regulator/O6-methylguanine-DNA methyltransferase Ada [Terrihabitans sp. PJ23]MDX6805058.1 bifunctional DNA-binding transcriptional regulator/O6-methylguanine-DNA methyltransferase Ada [Terrihabitans sp. PJ23]
MGAEPLAIREDDPRWTAVLERREAEGFVYAVRSTGIFCRPSCPSRRPQVRNVIFYADAGEALRAGFRACLRCRPDGEDPRAGQQRLVKAACRTIEAEENAPGLGKLSHDAGLSPFHFQRVFRAVTGVTPAAYARAVRERRMREALATGSNTTGAIYEAGYASPGRFYAVADSVLGMTPAAYRRGGQDMRVEFATTPTVLGLVLAARTDTGLCAILIGEDAASLEADLRRRFPRADLHPGGADFASLLALVATLVDGGGQDVGLPLDIRGTAFQHRVWQALRAIPPGQTVSYAELAALIGAPGAVRAVAGACAANPLAIAVPCHRVVRSDGGLSGYRWGVDRKRRLLERERGEG